MKTVKTVTIDSSMIRHTRLKSDVKLREFIQDSTIKQMLDGGIETLISWWFFYTRLKSDVKLNESSKNNTTLQCGELLTTPINNRFNGLKDIR